MSNSPKDQVASSRAEVNNILSTAFFTIKPISTELLTKSDVPVCSYTTGSGLNCSNPRLLQFQSIDLDTWAEASLKVIDIFFEPRFAHSVALIDRLKFNEEQAFLKAQDITADSFTTAMLNARESLANTISTLVVPVLAPASIIPDSLQKARDRYKQQLLSKLGSAYFIDALVQATVSVTPKAASDEGNSIPLTVPVVTANGEVVSGLTTTPEEDETANLYGVSFFVAAANKESRSTLTALIGHQTPQKIEVPIDLKAYPPIPTLSSQSLSNKTALAVTDRQKLLSALTWDYSYSYSVQQAAQDQIYSRVAFNTDTPLAPISTGVIATQKLFDDLAQFSVVKEALSNDLIEGLQAIGQNTISEAPNIDRAYFAIASLVQLSNNLADSWAGYKAPLTETGTSPANPGAYEFIIVQQPDTNFENTSEGGQTTVPRLLISIVTSDTFSALDKTFYPNQNAVSIPNLPIVSLKGYEPENATDANGKPILGAYWYYVMKGSKKEYLSFAQAHAIDSHTVTINGFDIFKTESAQGSCAIIRNEHLLENIDTAPELIYHSLIVDFNSSFRPSFTSDLEIDISRLNDQSGIKTDLANHLSNLFSLVFGNSPNETAQISLQIDWAFSPASPTNDNLIQSTIPVLKQTEFTIKIPEDYQLPADGCTDEGLSFVCKVANAMKTWYANNQPSVNGAFFKLDFTVFSKDEPSSVLLEFTNLIIPYAEITDL